MQRSFLEFYFQLVEFQQALARFTPPGATTPVPQERAFIDLAFFCPLCQLKGGWKKKQHGTRGENKFAQRLNRKLN